MSALTLFFIIQIEYTAQRNTALKPLYLSQLKPWCNDNGVLNLHHSYYTTIMMSRWLSCHNPVSHGTNQPIKKSEFVQLNNTYNISQFNNHWIEKVTSKTMLSQLCLFVWKEASEHTLHLE